MFIKNKYSKWYVSIIKKSIFENRKKLNRLNKNFIYYEKHHIIPKCMGGKQTVLLTAKEHFICHLLLPFFTRGENKHKMSNALLKMQYMKSTNQNRYTSKNYDIIKRLISEKNSFLFKGKKKSFSTIEKMRQNNGKWIRTKEHRLALSKKFKGKMIGDDNPSRRKDVRKKISEKAIGNKYGLGNKSIKGLIWVNNGVHRTLVNPDNIPNGYVKGKKYALAKKM